MKNGKLTRSEAKEMYEMGIDQVKNVLNRGSYSATRKDVISSLTVQPCAWFVFEDIRDKEVETDGNVFQKIS